MSNIKHVERTVARLSVVAKDYSTYYIPGCKSISGERIKEIKEFPEMFQIIGYNDTLIGNVSKDCPCVVDYNAKVTAVEEK